MNRKRLDRDKQWGFQGFPYYQMRIDMDGFHGLASLIELTDGDYCYWDLPKSGRTPVCGKGMTWLQLIPDHQHRVITTKFLPKPKTINGIHYEQSVSVWYVDVIERFGYDNDGVLYFDDKYLDVIFDPVGDVILDDKDELDAAYDSGELTHEQYQAAIVEGDAILLELCSDITATEVLCQQILKEVRNRIYQDTTVFKKNVPFIAPNIESQIKEFEHSMWESASHRDAKRFLELVSEHAIMVCGGFRCTGKEYADVIQQFDLVGYQITSYETIFATDSMVQNHYIIKTKVNEEQNKDLEGTFHVTSTWEKKDNQWKLLYNMDSRVFD